jgi:hypothetical protein
MSTINIGSALPTGTNVIGNIKIVDTAGTNQAAVDANNNLHVSLYQAANAMAIDSSNNAHVGLWNGANQQAVNSGGNAAVNVAQINGTTTLTGNGTTGAGSQRVTIASDNTAFSVNAVESGTWTVQPGNTPNTSAWLVQPVAGTSGGSTPYHLISAASNNATSLKASAGLVYGYSLSNTNVAARYFKLYNKASAPAPATDTVVWTEQIPANGTIIAAFPEGMNFTTGIAFAAVANMSDTDNTSIGAGDLSIDIRYK